MNGIAPGQNAQATRSRVPSSVGKTISIAMATYNGEPHIAEQLACFARQNVLPAELVVTDDGSTDNTLKVIAAFAEKAPFPVRIEKNGERLGYRANFLKAASLCTSDLIAFSDQDDIWLPHKLEVCSLSFDNMDVLLTYHNATVVTDDLRPFGTLHERGAPQSINPHGTIDAWRYGLGFTLVLRRELLAFSDLWGQTADFYNFVNPEAHDQWFTFLATSLGSVGYIDEPLVLYRQHGKNTESWTNNVTVRNRFKNIMSTTVAGIMSYEVCATRRANILQQMQPRLTHEARTRAAASIVIYKKLQAVYKSRQKIYLGANILSRLLSFTLFLSQGGYRPRIQLGVGRQAVVRDLLRGVFFRAKK